MNKLIAKFECGKTKILSKVGDFSVTPAPGVGSLNFLPCDSIWTGDCHLWPSHEESFLSVHISSIDSIATRSSLDEDNEEWKVLFTRDKDRLFTYEYEKGLTDIIRLLSQK